MACQHTHLFRKAGWDIAEVFKCYCCGASFTGTEARSHTYVGLDGLCHKAKIDDANIVTDRVEASTEHVEASAGPLYGANDGTLHSTAHAAALANDAYAARGGYTGGAEYRPYKGPSDDQLARALHLTWVNSRGKHGRRFADPEQSRRFGIRLSDVPDQYSESGTEIYIASDKSVWSSATQRSMRNMRETVRAGIEASINERRRFGLPITPRQAAELAKAGADLSYDDDGYITGYSWHS